jgi:hypothetical protein
VATAWQEIIERVYATMSHADGTHSKPRFQDPASAEAIAGAEGQIGRKLPPSLASLLMEADGVMGMLSVGGGDYFEDLWLVWPTERIVAESLEDRSDDVVSPEDDDPSGLGFFAAAGVDGILFGFPPAERATCDSRVVVWHPMRGTVSALADSLEDFIDGWLTGRLTV